RGCSPGSTGALGHQDPGAGCRRAERRRRPGRPEADDDHVGRLVPVGDLGHIARCHVVRLAHSIPPCGVAETVAAADGPAAPTLGAVPTEPTEPTEPPPEL